MPGQLSPATARARARVAALARSDANDHRLPAARRDLRASKLEDHVARVLAEAPPLTAEQRSRIAALLAPGGRA